MKLITTIKTIIYQEKEEQDASFLDLEAGEGSLDKNIIDKQKIYKINTNTTIKANAFYAIATLATINKIHTMDKDYCDLEIGINNTFY